MPKKEQVMMSTKTSSSSKNYIDPDWLELKKEYDISFKKYKRRKNLELEKEKDDFAKMWVEAGFKTKETLSENSILKKKGTKKNVLINIKFLI